MRTLWGRCKHASRTYVPVCTTTSVGYLCRTISLRTTIVVAKPAARGTQISAASSSNARGGRAAAQTRAVKLRHKTRAHTHIHTCCSTRAGLHAAGGLKDRQQQCPRCRAEHIHPCAQHRRWPASAAATAAECTHEEIKGARGQGRQRGGHQLAFWTKILR